MAKPLDYTTYPLLFLSISHLDCVFHRGSHQLEGWVAQHPGTPSTWSLRVDCCLCCTEPMSVECYNLQRLSSSDKWSIMECRRIRGIRKERHITTMKQWLRTYWTETSCPYVREIMTYTTTRFQQERQSTKVYGRKDCCTLFLVQKTVGKCFRWANLFLQCRCYFCMYKGQNIW